MQSKNWHKNGKERVKRKQRRILTGYKNRKQKDQKKESSGREEKP